MIKFLKYLFDKIAPRNQNEKDEFYLIKLTLYYFILWYSIAWFLFYVIYKNI